MSFYQVFGEKQFYPILGRKKTSSGKYRFNLKSTNSQVIGTSEFYEIISARDNGIESVRNSAPDAKVEMQ
ncbi:MAG: DUF1508 domain-containing protein [Nitrosomonadales bacterium]|nr:MAG: DUF1508 domain-containing protein [Nitrosomonadales bacterium]